MWLNIYAIAVLLNVVVLSAYPASSPLADAAEKSDRAAIRTLLKQHADVNRFNPELFHVLGYWNFPDTEGLN